jgi:hypothetical protein
MYRRLNIFLIIGAVFTIITGTLLHFVYEWSGESLFVGIFSPINESVWEHLKLLFFPMSVWILIGYFIFGKKFKTYIPSAVLEQPNAMFTNTDISSHIWFLDSDASLRYFVDLGRGESDVI